MELTLLFLKGCNPLSQEKPSRKTGIPIVAAIIIVAVFAGAIFFTWIQKTIAQPDIRVENVKAQAYYNLRDCRAAVTGTLFNYGDADGLATVKVYTKWAGQIQDYEVKTVFVNAHTSKDVSADLDAPELSSFEYGIQIIEQMKA